MKKFTAKIVLSCITSILLLSSTAFAADPAPQSATTGAKEIFNTFQSELKSKPCINTEKGSPDEGYIVTMVEEPLNNEAKGETPNDNFVQRPCYRQTFQYILNDKKTILPELTRTLDGSTGCSEKLRNLAAQYKDTLKSNYICKNVQAILSRGGTSMLYGYIGMVYQWAASIVGIIAVLIIILSGIQISAGGGDPEAISSAKKRIIQSLSGIAVLFLSGLILYTINPDFFVR